MQGQQFLWATRAPQAVSQEIINYTITVNCRGASIAP